MASTATIIAVLMTAALAHSALASRPAPEAALHGALLADLNIEGQQATFNRRLLMSQQQDAANTLEQLTQTAAHAAEAAVVAATWGFSLEQRLAQLAESGAQLASEQQQEAAIERLVARAQAVAQTVIAATDADIAAIGKQLTADVPAGTSAAAMATLMQSASFHLKLKAAVDAAMAHVAAALAPHEAAMAAAVHAELAAISGNALEAAEQFTAGFLPTFSGTFSLNIVEATLLRSLWQD